MNISTKNQTPLSNRPNSSFTDLPGPIKGIQQCPSITPPIPEPNCMKYLTTFLEFPRQYKKHILAPVSLKRNSQPPNLLKKQKKFDVNLNQKYLHWISQLQEAKYLPNISCPQHTISNWTPVLKAIESPSYKTSENIESNNLSLLQQLNKEEDQESLMKTQTSSNVDLIIDDLKEFKINYILKGNSILLTFHTRAKRNLRMIKCEIDVLDRSAKYKLIIEHFNFQILPASLEVLQQFLIVLNLEVPEGKFSIDQTLVFENDLKEIPQKFYQRVYSDLNKILIPQFDTYFGICTGKIGKDQKLEFKQFESSLIEVCHKLTNQELEKEKDIKEMMEKSGDPLVLNRFLYKNIRFFNEEAKYCLLKNAQSIEFGLKRNEDVYGQFVDLIEMLQKCGIYANESFSVDLFGWYQERPVFTFEVPLFQVFDIELLNGLTVEDYNSKILKKVKESLKQKESKLSNRVGDSSNEAFIVNS